MDISASWWSDYQEAYSKRLDQAIGWNAAFLPRFQSSMSSGSWAVVSQENPDGIIVTIFGTDDPNAYCDFDEVSVTRTFGCTAHAGHDFEVGDYFTHSSYGGNGCVGSGVNFCSTNQMAMYMNGEVGHADEPNRFFSRAIPGRLDVFVMNFDINYPDGYLGEHVGTKGSPQPENPGTKRPTNSDYAKDCDPGDDNGWLNIAGTTFACIASGDVWDDPTLISAKQKCVTALTADFAPLGKVLKFAPLRNKLVKIQQKLRSLGVSTRKLGYRKEADVLDDLYDLLAVKSPNDLVMTLISSKRVLSGLSTKLARTAPKVATELRQLIPVVEDFTKAITGIEDIDDCVKAFGAA